MAKRKANWWWLYLGFLVVVAVVAGLVYDKEPNQLPQPCPTCPPVAPLAPCSDGGAPTPQAPAKTAPDTPPGLGIGQTVASAELVLEQVPAVAKVDTPAGLIALTGEWDTDEGVPWIQIWHQREGSKTPFNVRWRDAGVRSGGCGFYSSGTAMCRTHDDQVFREVPERVDTKIAFEFRNGILHMNIEGVVELDVSRKAKSW